MIRDARAHRLRVWTYAAALGVTPLLHALSFPPTALSALAWVAFVPWFSAIRLAGPRAALALTSVVTFTGSAFVASWLPRSVANYYGQPLVVGLALFVGVWAVTVAPWVLAFTACYRAVARRAAVWVPLLGAAAWTASELARVELLVGNPFGLLGYTQVSVPALIQIADLTGIYGVTFVIAAVNVALAEVWIATVTDDRRRAALRGVGAAAVAVALVAVYGVARLAARPPAAPGQRVAVAQANLDLGSQWREDLYGANLEEHFRLTRDVLDGNPARLVVWPESAMTFFLDDEPLYRRAIGHVLEPSGAYLLAGGPRKTVDTDTHYYNSAFLLSPAGEVLARYDKERLLPFAEYFPWSGIGLLRREFGRVREFTPGTATAPLPTLAGPAGVVICNEAMFPRLVRERVRAGARVLVNLTNDSWLGDVQYSMQALDIARIRAVEVRRPLVRASTSGPSAFVDPSGRVTAATAPATRGTIAADVVASSEMTAYARVGDVFGLACGAIVLLVIARPRFRRRAADSDVHASASAAGVPGESRSPT